MTALPLILLIGLVIVLLAVMKVGQRRSRPKDVSYPAEISEDEYR